MKHSVINVVEQSEQRKSHIRYTEFVENGYILSVGTHGPLFLGPTFYKSKPKLVIVLQNIVTLI